MVRRTITMIIRNANHNNKNKNNHRGLSGKKASLASRRLLNQPMHRQGQAFVCFVAAGCSRESAIEV